MVPILSKLQAGIPYAHASLHAGPVQILCSTSSELYVEVVQRARCLPVFLNRGVAVDHAVVV
jgi:hypothetical protein